MRKIFILTLMSMCALAGFSQEVESELTLPSYDDLEKKKKRDDADVFIGEPQDSDDYPIDYRREVSKPLMPEIGVEQEFNQTSKKKRKQTESFLNSEYYYPAKPKNAWQIGINGGISSVNGDVSSNFFRGAKPFVPGYTFGAYVKKPFSYLFSLRASYKFMEMWNTDWAPSTVTTELFNRTELAGHAPGSSIYHNSHTVSHDMTLDAIFSFGNMRFHKERSKVVFNVIVSAGGFMYNTWYDHFDGDGNPYDYSSIPDVNSPDVSKRDVLKALSEMRNGTYETGADRHETTKNPEILGYSFRPTFGGGFGLTFRVNRWMDIDLESRLMFTRDDLLDGHRWEEPSANGGAGSKGLTRSYDTYMTTTLGLNFKLVGKKTTEPTTLLNPMHYTYSKLAESSPEKIIEQLIKDADGDGVPDLWDQEENTPEGAPVDPKGRALDSDKDGIIDLYDLEPFSPPGYPVDEHGVAIVPPSGDGFDCEAITVFPSVHFDRNKFYIKPEFYAHLHNVAELMLLCPDLKLVASGMTDKDDNEKYNEQLSWNRVMAVVDYLTAKYGLDKERFIVEFEGKRNATGTSAIDKYRERKVEFRVAQAGDKGSSNPAAPHPGLKAGSDK
jgi:outer membrane protein OmpA-like peptidoglycan-associated protein